MRQADGTVEEHPGPVRSTMAHLVAHRHQAVFVNAISRVKGENASDSTHGISLEVGSLFETGLEHAIDLQHSIVEPHHLAGAIERDADGHAVFVEDSVCFRNCR